MILSWESADQSSLALGILNEAVEQISRHTDRASFWRAVCQNSRWIIPARRMCVRVVRPENQHQVVARFEQGEFLPVPKGEGAALSAWADRTRRARWVRDLGLDRGACPACDWLTGDAAAGEENGQILLVPVPGQNGVAARLLYYVPEVRDAEALVSIARIYAHHVGMAYRMLETVDRLRKSEARLATIFQQSGEGLVLHDLQGRILEVNRRFCDLVGLSAEELRQMAVTQLTPEPMAETGRHALETVVNEGFHQFEVELRRNFGPDVGVAGDDRFLAAVTATRINTEDGAIVQAVVRDITEERRLTQALEQARDRAESANRAKSEFLASMSHEIRTPMNAILGMGELLGESELSGDQAEYVRVLNKSGTALLVLINDVLDLARIESGRVELERLAFDPRDIGRNVHALLQVEARRKNLRFDLELSDALPPVVLGDTHRIQQILLNLSANAVKFTDAGSVRIAIRPAAKSTESAEQIALEFEVTDTGIGIPDASKTEIFESFSQVDRSITRRFGGTGLGLAIAAHLVRMMDGSIAVSDNPGGGSVFRFQLQLAPAANTEGASARPSAAGKSTAPETQLRILLVDDSEDNRLLVQSFLKRQPYEIHAAEDGAEAVRKFAAHSYDLVLMDMQMPVLDGVSATRQIRELETAEQRHRTPIVALTAYALQKEKERSLAAGCDAHLSKPINKRTLLEAIEQYAVTQR